MPISNDNQDYGQKDEKNKDKNNNNQQGEFTSDDLKGKQQVDADLDNPQDKAAEQSK